MGEAGVKLETQYTPDAEDRRGWREEYIDSTLYRRDPSREVRERWSEIGIRLPENCPPYFSNTEIDLHCPILVEVGPKFRMIDSP
jgi:predicted aconitase